MTNGGLDYDVVVVGGALSGSSVAVLLLREHPEMRILVVEKSEAFDRKVGEATTEVSGEFFFRRLGLGHHLAHEHLPKQSLRMWFTGDSSTSFDETVEIGAKFQSRFPSYQLDRSKFDQHLLETAMAEGAHVLRPARVVSIEVDGGGPAIVTAESAGGVREIRARWVVDTSGREAVLAKTLGLHSKLPEHPTAAIWARFSGVNDLDNAAIRKKYQRLATTGLVSRTGATNHLVGFGWWCWIIPLRGGDFSAGLVYDTRLFKPPAGDSPGERLKVHLLSHPVGKEMFSHAEPIDGDVRARAPLPYFASRIAGPNWQLAGDAAGFIDPLYSPGMDYCSWTARLAFARISKEYRGGEVELEKINADFQESYRSWFESLYLNKYYYLGDAQLMSAAYLLDISLFFFGPGYSAIVHSGGDDLNCLPFVGPVDRLVGRFMRFYNRRLSAIARLRKEAGCYGQKNTGWQELYTEIGPGPKALKTLRIGLIRWLAAEWHALGLRGKKHCSAVVPAAVPAA
ncbi:MAG: hypothetical protein Fur0032_00610 [Terrimicrobiaceae bacterium]